MLGLGTRQKKNRPAPWDGAIAHKDANGCLLLRGVPYIDGFCVGAKEWHLVHNPSHEVPEKHKGPTQKDLHERLDAFDPQTVSAVERVRRQVQESFC